MSTYTYTARDQQGIVQTGHLDAVTEDAVVNILQHRGLLVTSVMQKDLASQAAPAVRRFPRPRLHVRVTMEDQVLLCQQLATLVEAGVPLLKSLEVVSAQMESHTLLLALEDVRHDVAAGSTFRGALAKHPAVFPALWLNLVETGEASGHLSQSLQQLARHFESVQHLRNQAQTALTYPAFLAVAAVGVTIFFVYWLIPKFAVMFSTMEGMELPLLTRLLIGASNAGRKYLLLIIPLAALAVYLLRSYLRTNTGQWMRDQYLLRIPLFRALFNYVQLAEFSRGLSTLLDSGVPLLSSLEILETSATNKMYGKAIGEVRECVKQGKTMAEPMAKTGLFPPMTVQMVQVGEEVGELAKMTTRIANYYEERVEIFIARISRLFEPIAIVVMGGVVLVIVLSIFLPIFKMATSVRG